MADEEPEYFDEDDDEEEDDEEAQDDLLDEDADADDDDDDDEMEQDGSDEDPPEHEDEDDDDDQNSEEDSDREARLEPGQTRAKSTAQSRYEKACSERLSGWLNGYHMLPSPSTQKVFSLQDYRNALSFTAEPLAACPMAGSHVHCMALSADGSVLLSGGSDGYVRRYDVYNTINGRNLLTAAVRHQFAEGFNKGGFLSAIYANEEEEPSGSAAAVVAVNPKEVAKKAATTGGGGAGGGSGSKKSKGKKKAEEDEEEDEEENGSGGRLPVASVHALACHSDALWALAGSESGAINLMTLRHTLTSNRPSANGTASADGQHGTGKSGSLRRRNGYIQHVLRKHKGPVSALQLTSDQMGFVSGGWDRNVFQWDLNTGSIVREYSGHVGQISSLSFRPMRPGTRLPPSRSGSVISIHATAAADAMDETVTQPTAAADEFSSPTKSTTTRSRASATPAAADKQQRARSGSLASVKSRRSRSRSAVDLSAAPTENVSFDLPAGIKTEEKEGESAAMMGEKDADGDRLMSDAQASAQTPSKSGAAEMAMDSMMEEDLALERELNESLGIGLSSGAGHGRNDDEDEMSLMGLASKQRQQQQQAVDAARKPSLSSSTNNRKKPGDPAGSDGDSLFGDSSDATDADADGDADADADGEDDDTSPLAHRHLAQNGKLSLDVDAPGEIDVDADADADAEGEIDADGEADDADDDEEPLFLASRKHAADHSKLANGKGSAPNGKLSSSFSKPTLQKSSLASLSGGSGFDADTASFSPDVLLTTTLGGQVMLWDRRVKSDGKGGVHAIPLSEKTPPWCATATWSTYGDRIYVGRRNEVIEEWDLRALSCNNRGAEDGSIIWNGMSKPKMTRTLQLPVGCGPITSVISMPNDRHIVCGSQDNVRIWDTKFVAEGSKLPFKIVAGHNGAMVSSLLIDPTSRLLYIASGDRGWMGVSSESILVAEVTPQS